MCVCTCAGVCVCVRATGDCGLQQCVDCWGGVNELFHDPCHPTGPPQGDRVRQTGRHGDKKPTVAARLPGLNQIFLNG